jgi:hypothetical protein
MSRAFAKILDSTAATICARCVLPDTSLRRLSPGIGPGEFVDLLVANKEYVAGIEFVAHALPAREAVWWACLCIQHAFGDTLQGKERDTCYAAVQWVLRPTEENRIFAKNSAEANGLAGAAGSAATAAGIGGAAAAFTTAKAAANAVKLASIQAGAAKIGDTQRRFIALGLEIADGRFM